MNILLVEDDKNICEMVCDFLKSENYNVTTAIDGKMAIDIFKEHTFDIVLLDLMLTKISGLEVLKYIRSVSVIPVIIATAKDSDTDKMLGLNLGADDYIAKPFAIEELLARIEVVFRRQDSLNNSIVKFKDIVINKSSRSVKRNGNEISLTNKEYELLMILVDNKDKVVTREELLEKIWGYGYEPETNVTDVYVRYLRTKLNNENKEEYIQTVRSVGYIMRG